MKAIFTASLLVLGFSLSTAEAGHGNQANLYAATVDKEAHHLDEDLHQAFPHHAGMSQKAHKFLALAHSTRELVVHRTNLDQAEYNIHMMQKTLSRLDADLHFIAENHPHFQAQKTVHLLKVVHQLEGYLEALADEVHDLNHVVILPHPHHGYGYGNGYNHYNNNHIVVKPAGIHIHKGGFNLNFPF